MGFESDHEVPGMRLSSIHWESGSIKLKSCHKIGEMLNRWILITIPVILGVYIVTCLYI